MAITLELTTPQGFTTADAYFRITRFSGEKNGLQVVLEIYKDQVARESGLACIEVRAYNLDILGGATMAQMYEAIKQLPEFANATDC